MSDERPDTRTAHRRDRGGDGGPLDTTAVSRPSVASGPPARSRPAGPDTVGPWAADVNATETTSEGPGAAAATGPTTRARPVRPAEVERTEGADVDGSGTGTEVPTPPSTLPVAVNASEDGAPVDPRRSDVDEWGRSEHVRSIVRRLYDPVYKYWFRVEWDGLEKIPQTGGALLICNHAGAIPSDAPAIMHGIEEELGRPVYGLADYFFRTIPFVGTMWSRTGGVPAHPDNAYRLLHDQQQLALVFPEGTKATSKTYTDRYRLRRFGRGGFVEIAMRAGVPIVPIACVGAEESMPIVFRLGGLAKVLNLPYFPVTANALLLGPIGYVTYFPAKMKLRVLDPVTFDVEPGRSRYSRSRVMDEAETIRAKLQDALHDMLRERRSVWFG